MKGMGACLESGEPVVDDGVQRGRENPWYPWRGLGIDCRCPRRRGMSAEEKLHIGPEAILRYYFSKEF